MQNKNNQAGLLNEIKSELIIGLKAHKWGKDEGSKGVYDLAIDDAIIFVEEYFKKKNEREKMIKRFIHWIKLSRKKSCRHCCLWCEWYYTCKDED